MEYRRLDLQERLILQQLVKSEKFIKKNKTINIHKIAKQMERAYATIWQELHKFNNIFNYNAVKA